MRGGEFQGRFGDDLPQFEELFWSSRKGDVQPFRKRPYVRSAVATT